MMNFIKSSAGLMQNISHQNHHPTHHSSRFLAGVSWNHKSGEVVCQDGCPDMFAAMVISTRLDIDDPGLDRLNKMRNFCRISSSSMLSCES